MKIPEGLQEHALFRMDGRIWIEPLFPAASAITKSIREKKLKKGWMKIIPSDKLAEFVDSL